MKYIDRIRTIIQAFERNHDTSDFSAEEYETLEIAAIKAILDYPLNIAYKKLEEHADFYIYGKRDWE